MTFQDIDGKSDFLSELYLADPGDDKIRIEQNSGGLQEGPYRWMLNDTCFQRWRDDEQSRLLWIKGDPGRGKTMLLCGVINELKSAADTNLSFFFCRASDTHNNATAVLRGLIYLLVHQSNQKEYLVKHVKKEYEHKRGKFLEGENGWVVVSRIFTNILRDLKVQCTYLLIDALDECKTGLRNLLKFIAQVSSASSCVRWVVSSYGALPIECPGELRLELKRQVLGWYEEIFKMRNETLGPDHRETSMACEKALKWYEEIYKIRNQTLGFGDPGTLEVACGMARMLERQGRCENALIWYEKIYRTRNETLGFDDPGTLEVACGVARILERQGRCENALIWYKEIYRTRNATLGFDDPETMKKTRAPAHPTGHPA